MEIFVKYSVDAILLILLITNILDSARKGFFRCVLSLVCVFAAIFASVTFSQPLAEWSYDNIFSVQIEAEIEQALEDGINSSSVARAVTSVLEVIPGVLTTQLEEMGIDINALTENISSLELSASDTAEKVSADIIRPAALVLLKMICYVLIFIAVRFVLGLIIGLIDKLPAPKLFRRANKWLGAALGTVKGVILVLVICLFINACSGLFRNNEMLSASVENSRICSWVSELGEPDLDAIKSDINSIVK